MVLSLLLTITNPVTKHFPDQRSRRRYYTLGLAQLPDRLLPDDLDERSISTLPLGWRYLWGKSA